MTARQRLGEEVTRPLEHLGRPTLEDEIRSVATMASIALALLVLFTNRRAGQLQEDNEQIKAVVRADVRRAAPDMALALSTLAAVIAMLPLFVDAADLGAYGTRDGVLRSLFSLVWIGFTALFGYQCSLIWRRLVPRMKRRRDERRRHKQIRGA